MEVRDVLNSVSAVGMKDILLQGGCWRVKFHDSGGSEFFTKMVDGKVNFQGTVLRTVPWIFWYSVDQVWDQLEKYANLERQKAQDAKGFGTKVSAVSNKGCAVWLSMGEDQRAATNLTADHRWQPSDLKTIQSKVEGKGGQQGNPRKDGVQNPDQHQRGKGKGHSQGKNKDWTPKDYSQQGGDPSGSRWTESGGKSGGKGGQAQGKSGNQDGSKVNGNPLYIETPANKTLGKGKDSGGRGKGKSNKINPDSDTSNNKGQGGKKGGGGKSFGGRGRGKGVNAVEAGEQWVDEEQVQDVQLDGEEELH